MEQSCGYHLTVIFLGESPRLVNISGYEIQKADTLRLFRANKRKILEFLCNQWAIDRKFEWSTWMVHTKVQMPEQYIGCWVDESSYQPVHGRPAIPQKITDDVILSSLLLVA